MNKQQFIDELRKGLAKLPDMEADKSLAFYSEMIDDRIEEGEPEEQAVAAMGDPSVVAQAIVEELPAVPKAIIKSKTKSKTLNWILLIVGSPIWASLALAAAAVLFSIYLVIWCLVVTIWVLAIGLLLGLPLGMFVFGICVFHGEFWLGTWELGAGLMISGIGIFCLFGALKASAALMDVSKRYVLKVRSWFKKKETTNEL